MSARIPLSIPQLTGSEARYVQQCIDENFVSSVGPFVERFEREFAEATGAAHAVACASGTAALHLALRLAGAGPGAVVAVSTFTFIASANAIAYTGAEPLLVDSEPESWNLDPELLHDEVERRAARGDQLPAAIEVVHVLGHPARLEPLLDLRERFGIPLVEDAAEALGATYRGGDLDGRSVGSIGDYGCFSFNGNKVITTGGGGMLVTADPELAERGRHLSTQAKLPARGYAHDEVGYNYRLTNVAAALGVGQLEQLGDFVEAKRAIAARYDAAFADLPVGPAPAAAWAEPSHWLYSVLLEHGGPDREAVLDALAAAGVEARPLWQPLHRQLPYRSAARLGGDVSDDLYERGISLPSSVGLTDVQQEQVIEAMRSVLSGTR